MLSQLWNSPESSTNVPQLSSASSISSSRVAVSPGNGEERNNVHNHVNGNNNNSNNEDRTIIDISKVNPKEVDALLAQELNQLSMNERERAMEEIHGVHGGANKMINNAGKHSTNPSSVQKEEESKLNEALHQMDVELSKMSQKQAYHDAVAMNSSMVNDKPFRTKFIYAENYDPYKAAVRMVNYLEFTNELFGPQTLQRPVQWKDLSTNALDIMNQGGFQIAPCRDQAHRRIAIVLKDRATEYSARDRVQGPFYMMCTLSEEVESQRLGLVMIVSLAEVNYGDHENNQSLNRMLSSMPIRISGFHLCSPDTPQYRVAKAAALLIMGADNRSKVRFHGGSFTECLYSLKSFGIPADDLPPVPGGGAKDALRKHFKWCHMRQTKEKLMENSKLESLVECPRQEDCLFGKGQSITKHPGNVGMRKLVEARLEQYQVAAFKDKSRLAWEVVNEVKECGGRFLKEETNGLFEEVDDESCRKKVSIAFRDLMKKSRQRQELLDQHREVRKHKLKDDDEMDDSFELFPRQNLESDTFSFLGLAAQSRKRHKGVCSDSVFCT